MLALHFGLGNYAKSPDKMKIIENGISNICSKGIQELNEGKSCVDVCTNVTVLLEDWELTNCGFGSNLTENGIPEMEAAIMEGSSGRFGGVSCVRNFANPIKIATSLLYDQKKEKSLVYPPQYLSGVGIDKYATSRNFKEIRNEVLISKRSLKNFNYYKKKFSEIRHEKDQKSRFDTIGVICVDQSDQIAVSASSGGTLFRPDGRVGHVSLPCGSGIWALSSPRVATCTTGLGEVLAHEILARNVCITLSDSLNKGDDLIVPLTNYVGNVMSSSHFPREQCLFGGISVAIDSFDRARLIGFTSCYKLLIGFASLKSQKPRVKIINGPSDLCSSCAAEEIFI